MSKASSTTSGGISVLGVLGIVFVAFKLIGVTEVATWSWLWVTAPFWIGFAVALAMFAVALAMFVVIGLVAVVVAAFDK